MYFQEVLDKVIADALFDDLTKKEKSMSLETVLEKLANTIDQLNMTLMNSTKADGGLVDPPLQVEKEKVDDDPFGEKTTKPEKKKKKAAPEKQVEYSLDDVRVAAQKVVNKNKKDAKGFKAAQKVIQKFGGMLKDIPAEKYEDVVEELKKAEAEL